VTDANLLLDRLPRELAGGLALDRDAAARALGDVDPRHAIAIANAEMLRALRLVSVERGSDPRGFALIAFGGAGPLHACELADELGVRTVLIPRAAGVLSALGLVASEERRESVRSEVRPFEPDMELPREGEVDLRYQGQAFELSVPLGGDVAADFHAAHHERYGYADPDRPLELVAIRTAETRPAPVLELGAGKALSTKGPEVVELDGATCWVPAGWAGSTDDHGTLVLERA
jgi:N-methylhydantoinase A/oxoprolinase/acetone carboxylase beta subunit